MTPRPSDDYPKEDEQTRPVEVTEQTKTSPAAWLAVNRQPLRPFKKSTVLENRLFQQYWLEGVMARPRQKRRSTQPFEEKPKHPVACASGKTARWLANYARNQ
jgi:hypothetical protein